jgi:hypothetical protein
LQKYRTRYQIRELYIPKSLRNVLKKLTSQDFENFKNINDVALKRLSNKEITFLDLHNSYVNNLIQNKIPLNLIAKQIGLASTNELVEKYGVMNIPKLTLKDYF